MAFDFDCEKNSSNLYYQVYDASKATTNSANTTKEVLTKVSGLVHTHTGSIDFHAAWAVVATWENAQEWKGSSSEVRQMSNSGQ